MTPALLDEFLCVLEKHGVTGMVEFEGVAVQLPEPHMVRDMPKSVSPVDEMAAILGLDSE